MKEQVAAILGASDFISVLSDGSQARKIGKEKEIALVRTERIDIPTYSVSSVLKIETMVGQMPTLIKIPQAKCSVGRCT